MTGSRARESADRVFDERAEVVETLVPHRFPVVFMVAIGLHVHVHQRPEENSTGHSNEKAHLHAYIGRARPSAMRVWGLGFRI